MAAQPAQAAAAPKGHLRGEPPDTFRGGRDQDQAETFKRQFDLYHALNDEHEIMQTAYLRTVLCLSLIKGPLVNNWVADQLGILNNKVKCTQNPIAKDNEDLWNEFQTAFDTAFTDTTQQQKAQSAILFLRMKGEDLEGYIVTFKHLARKAGYELDAKGTTRLFALGLKRKLMDAVMHRNTQPETMNEWIDAATREQRKYYNRQAYTHPDHIRYEWTTQSHRRNGHRRHPNNETVPMDVDPPVFTQVRRAYTEEDKARFKLEGRCFNCDKQGHMARKCPSKKKQPFKPSQRSAPNSWAPRSGPSPFGTKPHFKKKSYGPNKGYRKSNKQRPTRIRSATIEEIEEEEGSDDMDIDQEDVPSLAVRTARLSEGQREQWLSEMRDMGINF